MPFLMTHLYAAKKLYDLKCIDINSLPQFYLGVAAPDAVHNRVDYTSEYKKESHLCVGDGAWGMLTNDDEWSDNVLNFLNTHENTDFLMGYCIHILTDIYNNMTVWGSFRQKYQGQYGGLYHQESTAVDIELGLNPQNENDFWFHIKKSEEFEFYNLISCQELKT